MILLQSIQAFWGKKDDIVQNYFSVAHFKTFTLESSSTNIISLSVFFISSHFVWNALRVGRQKNKSFLIQGKVGFWGSCGLGDSHKFISKITTAAKGAAASAISYCLVRCSCFTVLQLCSSAEYNSLAQLPRWLVVSEGYTQMHHFLRHSAGPYLIAALTSPSPLFGEHGVCLVSYRLNGLNCTDPTEKQPVLRNAIFLSNLFPISALQSISDDSRIMQGQRKEAYWSQCCCWQHPGWRGWEAVTPLGQVPHLVGSVALHAVYCPERRGSVGQGTSSQGRSWLWQHCCCKKHEIAGSAEILFHVNIYA